MLKKRFYKTVSTEAANGGFAVKLDGKPIKTPTGTALVAPNQPIAQLMAAEWEKQGEHIDIDHMPVTRILSIALDRVPQDRDALIEEIVRYAGSDLLCYRGEDAIRAAQERLHEPVLVWAKGHGITLQVTDGVMPVTQPMESLEKVRELVSKASDIELAALAMSTPLLGSALLAISLWQQRLSVEEAIQCARIEEDFQSAKWGQDPEAQAQWMKREIDIRGAAAVFPLFS